MKKVLFATTALVATAGVAAADVTFGGYGRFGILYVDPAVGNSTTDVTSRFRLQITATAESDMGVTLGAMTRMQQDNDGSADGITTGNVGIDVDGDGDNDYRGRQETGMNGVRFFARSGGLEVGVGNIYGALEFMPGQYPIDLGLTGHSYEYSAYNGRGDAYDSDANGKAGQNGLEVMYKMGDLSFHLSASDANDRVAAHVAYTYMGFTFAAAVQDSNVVGSAVVAADTDYSLSVGGNVGPADVVFTYAKNGDDTGVGTLNGDHFVLAASFDVGAATKVHGYVADADYFANTSYGIGVHHDLGGGTSLRGGISSTAADTTLVDMGVRFNF
jgi:outer membrane protein OmpU